jgi:type IV pilus assembly protein PilM
MASSNAAWGIEVGAYAVKALKLEADGDKVKVADYVIIPHAKVLSTPGVDPNDVLRVSLGTLVGQFDLSKATIAVSVPGHSAFARFAKLPPVEPKKVPDIVKFEAMQQIPFPLEEVEWDYQTFVSPDSPDVEVGIFAITKEKIAERLRMLEDVNISPDAVTLSPIAVFNALAYDLQFTDRTEGTIIVDVGTTSTDLVIADAGRVWVRTFPLGGHQFTEALVNQFKLSYAKAEKLKLEAEDSQHARHAFQAMRPIFTDLAQDIQRSIGYYQSLHKDAKLTRLIGMGSTFGLPGLRKYLKQQLGLEVYRIEEFKRAGAELLGDESPGGRRELFRQASLNLVTAYGLALQGLGFQTIGANLMPVSVVREEMWRGKVKWFGMAAGLGIATAGAMFIRPVMDHYAVAAMETPAVIQRAASAAAQEQAKASEAGVVGTATPDFRASNMISLLERREIYAKLVNDLGLMLEDANAKAPALRAAGEAPAGGAAGGAPQVTPAGPVFTLKEFQTDYVPPSAPEEGSTQAPQPKIRIQLVLTTSERDPQRLAISTVQRWLNENKERAGMPYRYIVPDPPWSVEMIQADASGTGRDAVGERTRTRPDERAGGRGTRSGRVAETQSTGEEEGSTFGMTVIGGGGPDLENLAPLRLIRGTPVEPTSTITVSWEAVMLPPPEKKDGAQ